MDPLSITTAVLTLVDVALKIKDSVERASALFMFMVVYNSIPDWLQ